VLTDKEKAAAATAREQQYKKWRASLKPGSEDYENLYRAFRTCLRSCENLAELQSTWNTTWRATQDLPHMRIGLEIIKNDRKAALTFGGQDNG
jgi:hypothetical protein